MAEEKEIPKQDNSSPTKGESKPISEGVREDIAKNFERFDTSTPIRKSHDSGPLRSQKSSTEEESE